MIITSIDVGFKGGIAKHKVEEDGIYLIDFYKMPIYYTEVTKKIKGKNKKVKKPLLYIEEIRSIIQDSSIIIIEDVHSLPFDGRVSSFSFGYQKGILTGISICTVGISNVVFVSPQSWKRYFDLSKDKSKSVKLVNDMYGIKLDKKDDGIAESILIGRYYIENNLLIEEEYEDD